MPAHILKPYIHMLNNLTVHNGFRGHIGKPHTHANGIPQGCPLSMLALALLMRPWILRIRSQGAVPVR